MGQVREMLWNTSKATSAKATALVGDTIYPVLPVALRRHFAEGPLMKFRCRNGKPHLKNWICVTAFKNMKAQNQHSVSLTFIKLSSPLQLCIVSSFLYPLLKRLLIHDLALPIPTKMTVLITAKMSVCHNIIQVTKMIDLNYLPQSVVTSMNDIVRWTSAHTASTVTLRAVLTTRIETRGKTKNQGRTGR